MNQRTSSFLLLKAELLPLPSYTHRYDSERSLNLVDVEGELVPAVLLDAPPTQRKTAAHPGDDEPDPDDERCY
jgi:hypothetical protein